MPAHQIEAHQTATERSVFWAGTGQKIAQAWSGLKKQASGRERVPLGGCNPGERPGSIKPKMAADGREKGRILRIGIAAQAF